MEKEWLALYIAIISAILALISNILIWVMKHRSSKEIEYLKADVKRMEKSEELRMQYVTPLIKSA